MEKKGAETCTRKSKEEKEFGAMVGDGKKKSGLLVRKVFSSFFSGVEFSGGEDLQGLCTFLCKYAFFTSNI